jgi:DNA repair protein RadD
MTNEEIARFFNNARPYIQGNPNLRDPQVEGWFPTRQHIRNRNEMFSVYADVFTNMEPNV